MVPRPAPTRIGVITHLSAGIALLSAILGIALWFNHKDPAPIGPFTVTANWLFAWSSLGALALGVTLVPLVLAISSAISHALGPTLGTTARWIGLPAVGCFLLAVMLHTWNLFGLETYVDRDNYQLEDFVPGVLTNLNMLDLAPDWLPWATGLLVVPVGLWLILCGALISPRSAVAGIAAIIAGLTWIAPTLLPTEKPGAYAVAAVVTALAYANWTFWTTTWLRSVD